MDKRFKGIIKSLNRTLAIAEKEWIQIKRDIRSLIMALFIPVFLLLIFAYALTLDIKNVRMAVLDYDRSTFSRQFISKFQGSEYLIVDRFLSSQSEIDKVLDGDKIKVVMVIPHNFEKDYYAKKPVSIQLLVDGSDSTTAIVATVYVKSIVYGINYENQMKNLNRAGVKIDIPLNVESRILYNPELSSKNFIVPGIIVII
jgi:ABC-2 type transport system permease protein